jgi:hypothetical protein
MDLILGLAQLAIESGNLGQTVTEALADGALGGSEVLDIATSAFATGSAYNDVRQLGRANTPPVQTSTSQVTWCNERLQETIGLATVPDSNLVKCNPSEFLTAGDVVKANSDLTWKSGKAAPAGTLGTLKELNEDKTLWLVNWWNGIGDLYVSIGHLKKCDPSEFMIAGDVVKANSDLTWESGESAAAGTLGILKALEDGIWLVSWLNGIGEQRASTNLLAKCDASEFLSVGDVVKANSDLTWKSGESAARGTHGILKAVDDGIWLVSWLNGIGEQRASQDLLTKCTPSEYWFPGDMLKTTCDLFWNGGSTKVPKGSLCSLVQRDD